MSRWVRPRHAGTRHNKRIPSGIAEPVTSSVSVSLASRLTCVKPRRDACGVVGGGAVVALGRPPHRARGGYDLTDP
jgi:hypothetical protein